MHLFHIEEGWVKSISNIQILKDTVENVDQQLWDKKWENWKNTLLLQLRDGTLILISLLSSSISCKFQGINSEIVEAHVHLMMDYLIV